MSLQTFNEALAVQPVAGTSFDTYTTAKSVIPAQNLVTLPANWWQIGRCLRVTVTGALKNILTTPGTVTMQVMMGSIIAFNTGPLQLNATSHAYLPFWLDVLLTCRAVGNGTSANLMGMGRLQGIQPTLTAGQLDATNTGGIFSAPASIPAVGTGFDSTIANILDFWVGFSISNGGNGVQVAQYVAEALN